MCKINYPLTDLLWGVERKFPLREAAIQALVSIEDVFTKIVLLAHPDPVASISVITDT